ncbi:hypothetical protein [Streptomyces sp. NPDC089795]
MFTVQVMVFPGVSEDGPGTRDALVAAAAEDVRALMAALRTS